MKLLSCKLQFTDGFTCENLYEILIKWLDGENYTDDLAAQFANTENKLNAKLETKYCKFEATQIDNYKLFRLVNNLNEQIWTTEVIFDTVKRVVTLHISCDGDTTRLSTEMPVMRTEILRVIVSSGLLVNGKIPITDKPVAVGEGLKGWLAATVRGEEKNVLPVVFATKIEDMYGYEIDENSLARKLAGIAHVAVEGESDLAFSLKSSVRGIPFNGFVGVYYPDAASSKTYKTVNEKQLYCDVIKTVTANTDRDSVDWDGLHTRINSDLVDLYGKENGDLSEELERAKSEIARLQAKCDSLQAILDETKNKSGLLEASDEDELYDFEQHDLIVCALDLYLKGCVEGTRSYDLAKSLREVNDYKSGKREDFDRIKAILDKGNLTERDFKELEKLGVERVRDNKHNIALFMGAKKYPLTIGCTPSDTRSGENTSAKVLNKISIFK